MRTIMNNLLCLLTLLMSACDVHQWPETPEFVKLHLRLDYDTDMTEWEYIYDDEAPVDLGFGKTYDNTLSHGKIRYIVRAYPDLGKQRSYENVPEFVFTRDIADGYNHDVTLEVPPGRYNIAVWSDLVENEGDLQFYDAADFSEIKLQGEYKGDTDYRDAFRGSGDIELIAGIVERAPDTLEITMRRPLAKFEFITNDVLEFVEKEASRKLSEANSGNSKVTDDTSTKVIDIEDYKVVFYYVGFMPDAFNIFSDKPVDSTTGVMFESTLSKITESEASMGFDYVFVNGRKSKVTVRIGIHDTENTQLALTEPIEIPLMRSYHTIVTGMFLMSEASGGVMVNPEYEGDHNLIYP